MSRKQRQTLAFWRLFERDSLGVCPLVCSSAAPELSHGDPRERPRDPRAGGESGFPGGGGETGRTTVWEGGPAAVCPDFPPPVLRRTERCMIGWTISWEVRGQTPTFHQSATPRSSTGKVLFFFLQLFNKEQITTVTWLQAAEAGTSFTSDASCPPTAG